MQQRGVYTVSTGLGGELTFAAQRPKDYYADKAPFRCGCANVGSKSSSLKNCLR